MGPSGRVSAPIIGATKLNHLTEAFKAVEIKETYQDDQVKDMQAFLFTLSCEKGKS